MLHFERQHRPLVILKCNYAIIVNAKTEPPPTPQMKASSVDSSWSLNWAASFRGLTARSQRFSKDERGNRDVLMYSLPTTMQSCTCSSNYNISATAQIDQRR